MSDSKPTNPKDAAATARIDLSLFPPVAIAWGALAMTEGDLKYGGYNYRVAGVQASVYVAAAMRHLGKWLNGQDADPKTRVPHLASVLACAGILADAIAQGNLNDDRPPPQSVAVYDELEAVVSHLQTVFPRRVARHRAAPASLSDFADESYVCTQGTPPDPGCASCAGAPAPAHHPSSTTSPLVWCRGCQRQITLEPGSRYWRAA